MDKISFKNNTNAIIAHVIGLTGPYEAWKLCIWFVGVKYTQDMCESIKTICMKYWIQNLF